MLKYIFQGKSVAIVGPSPSLIGKGLGEKIDSYDVVIRPNLHFDIPEHRKVDYGSRFEIFSSCFNEWANNETRDLLTLSTKKHIFNCQTVYEPFEKIQELLGEQVDRLTWIPSNHFGKIYEIVGTTTNSGFNAIILALQHGATNLFVCGMDFYNRNDFTDYDKIYFPEYKDVEFAYHPNMHQVPTSGHGVMIQKKYFMNLLQNNTNIEWNEITQ
jgi:hypothetical protein